jgi:von Willebrand factor type A domain
MEVRMRRFILAACAVWLAGCSTGGASAGAGGSGFTGSGGSSASGAGGNAGSGGLIKVDGGGGNAGAGGGGGLDSGCATSTAQGKVLPAVMEFVIDTSGSMGDPAPGGGTKWSVTQTALGSAFDNMPQGNAVGLFFFPGTDPSISGGDCIIKQQAVPIDTLGATASNQRTLITQALQAASPLGGTPTFDAYLFALNTLVASTLPGNKFIVLITDGAPTYSLYCQGDGQTPVPNGPLISEVANASTEGVRTFVIGSPGSESARTDLSKMASAGGTALPGCSDSGPNYCHFDMTTQPNLAQALNDALSKISGAALSCTFDVPTPPNGQTLNPSKVNVVFTPSSGKPSDILKDTGTTCTDGWQYTPDGKQIVICGPSCDKVKNDPGGKINIVFGCDTKVH